MLESSQFNRDAGLALRPVRDSHAGTAAAIRSGTHRIAKLDSFMWILASLDGHDMYKTKTNRYYFESHDFQLVAFLELYLF